MIGKPMVGENSNRAWPSSGERLKVQVIVGLGIDDIAFPSVTWALEHDRDVHSGKASAPFENPRGETGAVSE